MLGKQLKRMLCLPYEFGFVVKDTEEVVEFVLSGLDKAVQVNEAG